MTLLLQVHGKNNRRIIFLFQFSFAKCDQINVFLDLGWVDCSKKGFVRLLKFKKKFFKTPKIEFNSRKMRGPILTIK